MGGEMEYQDVIYVKEAEVATITLNRPERMNAFTTTMIDSIGRAFEDAAVDDAIRVILVIHSLARLCYIC